MVHQTITVWVCDRCGRKVEMVDKGQPDNFTQVAMFDRVSGSWDASYLTNRWELCATCTEALITWARSDH